MAATTHVSCGEGVRADTAWPAKLPPWPSPSPKPALWSPSTHSSESKPRHERTNRDADKLTDTDERGPVTFVAQRRDATDQDGALCPDKSSEADQLIDHDRAPEWATD
jgi:hypothetical protein